MAGRLRQPSPLHQAQGHIRVGGENVQRHIEHGGFGIQKVRGKPHSREEALAMLSLLSGRDHQVMTGCTVVRGEKTETFTEVTDLHFRPLREAEIIRYVDSGEPMDKAGAYGIQGGAALFCEKIVGDYYNVMGLPVCRLGQVLREIAPDIMEDTQ